MKQTHKRLNVLCLFSLCFLGVMIVWFSFLNKQQTDLVSKEVFDQETEVTEEEAMIGTNITLHQEIHGTEGITYRYKLKTDCPYWKYEDRYRTDKPLTWINKNAAVETKATAITISYQGTTYAQGQFFEVPLLQLTMDDQSKAEYIQKLQAEAYTAYKTEQSNTGNHLTVETGILILASVLLFLVILCLCKISTDRHQTDAIPSDRIQTEVPHAEQKKDRTN